jgi:hypothetical protein
MSTVSVFTREGQHCVSRNFAIGSSQPAGVERCAGKRSLLGLAEWYLCRMLSFCWLNKYRFEFELKMIFFCFTNQHLMTMFLLDVSAIKVQIMHEIDVHYSTMNYSDRKNTLTIYIENKPFITIKTFWKGEPCFQKHEWVKNGSIQLWPGEWALCSSHPIVIEQLPYGHSFQNDNR